MSKLDINIKQLHKQPFINLQSSQLILEFSGKDVNYALVNSLRRCSLLYVPTYCFTKDSITIETNTSIFDGDYMRLRLSQLTLPKIDIPINFLPEKYWKNVDYSDPNREKHPKDTKNLELYINAKNDSPEILNVTTDHCKVYSNGVEQKDFYKPISPSLIIQLRSGEEFNCRCVAVLGVGQINDIFAASSNCYYQEIDPTKFKFTIESQGQLEEYDILYKCCDVIKNKINDIKKIIQENNKNEVITKGNSIIIRLENEDHTIGNYINYLLQNNKDIAFSGLSKPDKLIDEVILKIMSVKPNPMKPLFETFDTMINTYDVLQSNITKLAAKNSK